VTYGIELAYVGLEVPEPASLAGFLGDVIGLVPGATTPGGAVTWRNDDKAHRIIIEPGPMNDARYLGFEAADASSFAAAVERIRTAGFEVTDGTAADAAERRVAQLATAISPWDVRVELVVGLEAADEAFSSEAMPGGFLTEGVGFGHTVFGTTNFDESHRFVTEALGLVQSDWLEMEIMEGVELEVHFYHCNERHHTVALARTPFELPQTLHHFMVETRVVDDVGAAFDRAVTAKLPIANSLGRHDNDGMFSFYVVSPAGFQVEVGHGARLITADWDDDRRYDRISRWGHQPLPQA
jgi:2,3-dihydroxybiphenyl 1,2-dioxygenase